MRNTIRSRRPSLALYLAANMAQARPRTRSHDLPIKPPTHTLINNCLSCIIVSDEWRADRLTREGTKEECCFYWWSTAVEVIRGHLKEFKLLSIKTKEILDLCQNCYFNENVLKFGNRLIWLVLLVFDGFIIIKKNNTT